MTERAFTGLLFCIILCTCHVLSVIVADIVYPGVGADGQPVTLRTGDEIPAPNY